MPRKKTNKTKGGRARAPRGRRAVDTITLEVIQEGLNAIVHEMKANFTRIAYSSILNEGQDFSCMLMDGRGQLISLGEGNIVHIFPLVWAVADLQERFAGDIHPGDLFIQNDPYTGGTHLNDIALIKPLFAGGKLSNFAGLRAHWADVGGMRPGSISGQAVEIYQEGIRIPTIRVRSRGAENREALEILFANMRVENERRGDYRAMETTLFAAERQVLALTRRYGRAVMDAATVGLLDRAEARMRDRIRALKDGAGEFEHYLDNSGTSNVPIRLRAKITVRGDEVEADFTGSASQVKGPINLGPAGGPTAAFMVLKAFLDPSGPINAGAFRPLTVRAPKGTLVNAELPAACGGVAEVLANLAYTLVGALARIAPDLVVGEFKGGANHTYISTRSGGGYGIFYEYPAGGTGAARGRDGSNTCRTWMEGDFSSIQTVEAVENEFPLRIESFRLRDNSAGPGETRGGFGLRRDVRLLAESGELTVLTDNSIFPPYGVHGGGAAAGNRYRVIRRGKYIEPSSTPGKVSGFPLEREDIVVMETGGGGGYGDPLGREPGRVAADVAAGYLTRKYAREVYGVVLRRGKVDAATTAAERKRIGARRLRLKVRKGKFPGPEGGPNSDPVFPLALHPRDARGHHLREGEIAEAAGRTPTPLPVRIRLDESVPRGEARLPGEAIRILDLQRGGTAWIRSLADRCVPSAG